MRRLGLLGGTFDPIHYGHLDAAEAALASLPLDEVWLIPSHVPPHRSVDPRATPFHRFAMVSLAIDGRPRLRASDRELARSGATYTIDTLHSLHADGWSALQLFFILGSDAFADIATWRSFPDVLDASNFVVITRPGTTLDEAFARAPQLRARMQTVAPLDESRAQTAIFPVAAQTRDVSSTEIRTRLLSGHAIDDLVPAAVARHIQAHHLYGAVDDLHGEEQRTSESQDSQSARSH